MDRRPSLGFPFTDLKIINRCATLLLLAIATLGPGHVAAQEMGGVSLPLGAQAPTASVQDLDGNPLDLLEIVGGRPAVIEFWASWCENCEALQPQLDELHERYGEDLAIVAVAVAVAQTRRRVQRHAEGHGIGYPFVWDADGEAVRAYEALTTSIVVMLDADGQVTYTGVGSAQDLVGAANRLMGGSVALGGHPRLQPMPCDSSSPL